MDKKIISPFLIFYFFIAYIGGIYLYILGNSKEAILILFINLSLFDIFIHHLRKVKSFNENKVKIIGRLILAAIGVLGFILYFTGSIFGYFMLFTSTIAIIDLVMILKRS